MTAHSLVHEEAARVPRRRVRRLVQLGWPQFIFLGGILGLLALSVALLFVMLALR